MSGQAVPIVELTGPMLVGLCLNWGLFGCASVQTYYYYCFFPNDRWGLKALVYFLYIWDVSQTILYTQDWFIPLASGWGNLDALQQIGTSWFSVPFMSGISSATVQCFYAWRVYRLSHSYPLFIGIVLIALMEGSAGLALGFIMGFDLTSFSELQDKTFAVTSVWLLGSAVCDIVICSSMLYFLHREKSKSSFRSMESLLTRLIRLSVGAGALTAAVAIVDGVLYLVFAHNNFHMAPAAILGKLYTNSLLVLMNSRRPQRSTEVSGNTNFWNPGESGIAVTTLTRQKLPVNVSVDVNVEQDGREDANVMMVSFDDNCTRTADSNTTKYEEAREPSESA